MRLRNFVFCVLLSMVFLGADLNISVNALNSEEYVEERKEIVLINIEYLNELNGLRQ